MSTTHAAPRDGKTKTHPLAHVVLAQFERMDAIDVTDIAIILAGALVHPAKGREAYRIVAADVLGYLWHQGALVRHGTGNPASPERGGFWYTRAARQE
jgi:hypothetical protein